MSVVLTSLKRSFIYTGIFIAVMIVFTLLGLLTGFLTGFILSLIPYLNDCFVRTFACFGLTIQTFNIVDIFTVIGAIIGVIVGYKYNTEVPDTTTQALPEDVQYILDQAQTEATNVQKKAQKDPMVV